METLENAVLALRTVEKAKALTRATVLELVIE